MADSKLLEFDLHSGYVHVSHGRETLQAAADPGAALPAAELEMYYETGPAAPGDHANIPKDKHVLLLHSTGFRCEQYKIGPSRKETLVGNFLDRGYQVTLVDLRGHGRTQIPPGPYTVPVLAADVAAAVAQLFPGEKFHVFGVSIGFGVGMALALRSPELCLSLAGSGFLFDRTRRDVLAYIFSRPLVIRMIGMRLLAPIIWRVGHIHPDAPLALKDLLASADLQGFTHTSGSWLRFNLVPELPGLRVPSLVMHPEYDTNLGHTRELHEAEVAAMPAGLGKLVHFPKYSHLMHAEPGGAQLMVDALEAFLGQRAKL